MPGEPLPEQRGAEGHLHVRGAAVIGIVNRRVLRWALLSATAVEARLVGSPTRY